MHCKSLGSHGPSNDAGSVGSATEAAIPASQVPGMVLLPLATSVLLAATGLFSARLTGLHVFACIASATSGVAPRDVPPAQQLPRLNRYYFRISFGPAQADPTNATSKDAKQNGSFAADPQEMPTPCAAAATDFLDAVAALASTNQAQLGELLKLLKINFAAATQRHCNFVVDLNLALHGRNCMGSAAMAGRVSIAEHGTVEEAQGAAAQKDIPLRQNRHAATAHRHVAEAKEACHHGTQTCR